MLKTLITYPERCTGCRRCEMWCSMKRKGVINTERAQLHILRREPAIDSPQVCLQCGICLDACPDGLIKRNKKTGAVEIDREGCKLCGHCVVSCPYGMITIDRKEKKADKCDLCGGDPECVKHCREKAIAYVNVDQAAFRRREAVARGQSHEGRRRVLSGGKLA